MNSRHLVSGIAACTALAASAGAIAWLIKSSQYAERPPMFAVAAFVFAVAAAIAGVAMAVRTASGLRRASRESPN